MSIVHYVHGPQAIGSKILLIIVIMASIRQTLKLMRIFSSFSSVVAMLSQVIYQLRIFITFYFILQFLFSLILGILGIGNVKVPGNFRDVFYKKDAPDGWSDAAPNYEYHQIGLLWGNLVQEIRISMGDFAILDCVKYIKDPEDSIVFWLMWFAMVLVSAIVFLNFVVAEATNSYNNVNENLEEFIEIQKGELIADAESILPNKMKKLE